MSRCDKEISCPALALALCEKQIHCGDECAVIDSVNHRGVNARFYKKSGDGPPKIILITWEDLAKSWRDEDENPVGAKI